MPNTVEIADIRDAMDPDSDTGPDLDTARSLADAYVGANPGQFTELATKTLAECVRAVDVFGFESEDLIELEARPLP